MTHQHSSAGRFGPAGHPAISKRRATKPVYVERLAEMVQKRQPLSAIAEAFRMSEDSARALVEKHFPRATVLSPPPAPSSLVVAVRAARTPEEKSAAVAALTSEIEKQLVDGVARRQIATTLGMHVSTLSRYIQRHLPQHSIYQLAIDARAAGHLNTAEKIVARLKAGEMRADIARRMRITSSFVSRIAKKNGFAPVRQKPTTKRKPRDDS